MYWEDFVAGVAYESAARTITEADIVSFAGLSGDFNPLHTDAEFAQQSIFGQRIAHGLLGLAIASGLQMRGAVNQSTILAFLGINQWTFRAPILIGDTVRVRMTVLNTRETRKPDRGIVTQQIELRNQRGAIVQHGEFVMLVQRRPAEARNEA